MQHPGSSTEEGTACFPDTGSTWAPTALTATEAKERRSRFRMGLEQGGSPSEGELCWLSPATELSQGGSAAHMPVPKAGATCRAHSYQENMVGQTAHLSN